MFYSVLTMKVYLEVYGCTANKSDASLIKGLLIEDNNEIVKNIDDSNIIIILTCTVIGTTEQRMISRLKKFKEYGKKIIVTGCMASVQTDLIKKIYPEVLFLPPQFTPHIVDFIKSKKIPEIPRNKTNLSKSYDGITAPISISEGCMFSCSYCITSLARGKLRSFPIDEIIKDARFAVRNGIKEIQLTAQDTSSYGFDSKKDLGELLRKIVEIEGEYRIRVGMMNPYTALKNLDSILLGFNNLKIYKFLHLPVQSGNNEILEKMERKYSVKEFKEIVNIFRKKFPDITISTDVIVGFPDETDEQFNNTIELLKNVKPDITNITRFSARPYTKAKTMKGRLKTEIVKDRSKKLTVLCSDISKQNNLKYVGKTYNVLVTEIGKNNTYMGRSENYKTVVIKDNVKIGEFKNVKITKAEPVYLVGSLK